VGLHADPVTEDGPTSEGAARIDGDDGDGLSAGSPLGDQRIDQAGFADPRASSDPDDVGFADMGEELAEAGARGLSAVVDVANQPRRRDGFAGEDTLGSAME